MLRPPSIPMADLPPTEQPFFLEKNKRLGLLVLTFYKDSMPFGSLTVDPIEDSHIIETCDELVKGWAERRTEEIKRERARQDERQSRRRNRGPKKV